MTCLLENIALLVKITMKPQEPYKICFYSDAKGYGGAEKYLIYLADGLSVRGRMCCFITNNDNTAFNSSIDNKFSKSHIVIKSDKYYEARHYGQLYRTLKKLKPDIFHYNLPGPYSCSLLAPIVAKLAGVKKVVTTEHLPMMHWWRKPAILKRIASLYIDKAIAVSHANKGYMLSRHHIPEKKIKVIQNGIDVNHFSFSKYIEERVRLRKEYGFSDADVVFGVVGRLEEQKGHIYALRSLAKIQANSPNAKLVFFGEGTLGDFLKIEAVKLGIDQKVTFAGFQGEMAPAYACIDVLLMPSLFEGLPLALLEAMSMQRPAIATAIHGIPEVIHGQINGILVQPKDIDGIAHAMDEFAKCSNQNLLTHIGNKSGETVRANFSLEKMVDLTDDLFVQ